MKLSRNLSVGLALVLVVGASAVAAPVGTAFTYQGRIEDGGAPANGVYDLEFTLYDAATAGLQVGSAVTREDVAIANGLFVVALDFGNSAFDGNARWLQIGVRPGASVDAFTPLASRQDLTPTPNAIYSQTTLWSGVSGKPAGFADDVDNDSGGDITGVSAGSGLTGGGTSGNVTLGLDTATTDGRYVLKAGDTMTGTLTLSPISGVGLSTSADINLLGRVMRGTTPFIHADTRWNTAIGENALSSNTTGSFNTATGLGALRYNTTGAYNAAMGMNALMNNINGVNNTATGHYALRANTQGNHNTATGYFALYSNTTGYSNTAVGTLALDFNTVGANNIALGFRAGFNATTGDNNIYIGHEGVAAEANTIRIGTFGNQTRFFAMGINGVPMSTYDAVPVLIDIYGQLGVLSSSNRFKEDVRDMSDTSEALFQLRPVTFRYKGRPNTPEERHYGLIAEEVSGIIPELVAHSADGQIESVKYHELPAMLLNELQKLYRQVQEQQEEIVTQRSQLRAQGEKIAELMARLAQSEGR